MNIVALPAPWAVQEVEHDLALRNLASWKASGVHHFRHAGFILRDARDCPRIGYADAVTRREVARMSVILSHASAS